MTKMVDHCGEIIEESTKIKKTELILFIETLFKTNSK